MKPPSLGCMFSTWTAVLGCLFLSACGGGGGSSGATSGGSLTPATTQASVIELTDAFAATLNGAQQVPQRQSSATGSGTVVIQPSTRVMTATLTTTGIAGTDAQIRQAQAGLNGPLIFPMTEVPRGSGVWTARAVLTEAQYNAFRAGEFYFNVQSIDFGNGEIRGQILSQQLGTTPATTSGTTTSANTGTTSTSTGFNPFVTSTATFLAALRGTQEVPPVTSGAIGAGTVLINPASRQLTAGLTTSGIAGTGAQIREAAPGANGPVITGLVETAPGSGVWITNATLTDDQLASLQSGNFYFNISSAAFPGGEIRGQILPQTISLEFITGAAGRTTPATSTTGTGTTGTGVTGTGLTGTGTTGSGLTGTTTTGAGAPSTGPTAGLRF